MTDDLRALAEEVHRLSGVVVRDGQIASLRAALARVDPRLTPAALIADPDPGRLEQLVDEVAVKETFFLRHLEEIEDVDWPGAAAAARSAGRPLRVWSAGCSTGEEAYSLALLAAEALGDDRPAVDVLGTDLSSPSLALAHRARYGTRSMRLVDARRRTRWFVPDGERLRVGEELRGLVRFARHNLVHDPFPPRGEAPFDLVVCRNVLIYFDEPTCVRVAAALWGALAPGGRLVLGTVDRLGHAPPVAIAEATRRTGGARHDRPTPARGRDFAADVVVADPRPEASSVEAAHAAFEAGSQALSAGNATGAVDALRRALYLDPRSAVVALQLAWAHESLDHLDAARRGYRRALRLVDEAPGPVTRLYDRVGAVDVAATCRARLAVLSTLDPAPPARTVEP